MHTVWSSLLNELRIYSKVDEVSELQTLYLGRMFPLLPQSWEQISISLFLRFMRTRFPLWNNTSIDLQLTVVLHAPQSPTVTVGNLTSPRTLSCCGFIGRAWIPCHLLFIYNLQRGRTLLRVSTRRSNGLACYSRKHRDGAVLDRISSVCPVISCLIGGSN
jgi:hypothetical protein